MLIRTATFADIAAMDTIEHLWDCRTLALDAMNRTGALSGHLALEKLAELIEHPQAQLLMDIIPTNSVRVPQ